VLHITNGDCAVAVLSPVVPGTFLPWRDVLHEGPVRAGLAFEELSRQRAAFIAAAGWGSKSQAEKQFEARDAAFRRAGEHDEIVLWFEHDLYDQLQLIQVLDGLAAQFDRTRGPPISLVCEAEYLGSVAPARAAELFSLRNPVTRRHTQEARAAWAAFRSPDPRDLENLKTASLPFLGAALRRHLEEFPWTTDSLSRLERAIVDALQGGPLVFGRIFASVREEPAFLGDTVLAWHLDRMSQERVIERRGAGWALISRNKSSRVARWLGGYEVKDETLRWDPGLGRLVGAR
jgi:hypothetical protein